MTDPSPERLTLHLRARIDGLAHQAHEAIQSLEELSVNVGGDGIPAKLDHELRIVRTERSTRIGGAPMLPPNLARASDVML
jgi:hypothetical protein